MDFLKAEIERKKRLLKDQALVGPDKKYFKREDLIKREQDEYRAKLKIDPEELTETKSNEPSTSQPSSASSSRIMNRKEVIRRLRERNEPIRIFGETDEESFERLRQIELREPELSNRGQRNDFQAAMDQVDQDYLKELIKSGGTSSENKDEKQRMHDVKIHEMGLVNSIDDIKKMAEKLGRSKKDMTSEESKDIKDDTEVVFIYLKYLLELWGKQLNYRSEDDKISMAGKIACATYSQTVSYLKPLFKQLKNKKISADILRHLVNIVRFMLEREYVKANDAYLQMAIGNSPWPIGVTMVGIHARTGREKIFSQNIAHVLNDETQRKYIQALKRLMTHCQRFFPTDPSKCVEYNAWMYKSDTNKDIHPVILLLFLDSNNNE